MTIRFVENPQFYSVYDRSNPLADKRPKHTELRPGVLPQLIGYRLRLAQQAVFRDFAASVGAVSPGRAGILLLIESNPGVAQGRLAQAVRLDRSTMVGVVDALEDLDLIERRRGVDRRSNGLWLTPAGRAFVARLKRRIEAHERRVAAHLTAAERGELLALLEKLAG
jgi:DNA-binding MarR family transcriptional regulator